MRSDVGPESSTDGERGGRSTPADRRGVDGSAAFDGGSRAASGGGSWVCCGDGSRVDRSKERLRAPGGRIDGMVAREREHQRRDGLDVFAAGGGSRSQQTADGDVEPRRPFERLTEVVA